MPYRVLYSGLFYLAIPFAMLRLLYRSIREPLYRTAISERFGFYQSRLSNQRPVWVHAVSAGETIAAVPLIRALVHQGHTCLVTHMTPTGRGRVQILLAQEIAAGKVDYCWMPYDLPGATNRFIKRNQPQLMVTIDTELWPNTISACNQHGVLTALVNGRLSERSAAGYQRISALAGPMLRGVGLLAVQTDQHRKRFLALGVLDDQIHVTGSLKFDAEPASDHADRTSALEKMLDNRLVLLGASTHEGEEAALLTAFSGLEGETAEPLLVLVPRHTHRTRFVQNLCREAGLQTELFSEIKTGGSVKAVTDVLIVDVMGELEGLYHFACLAFVGGSLVPSGGHNLLEAVRAGVPVVMGPHLDNIDDIAAQFIAERAMFVAPDAAELARYVSVMFNDRQACEQQSMAARQVLMANQGALERVLLLLTQALAVPFDASKTRVL